MTRKRAAYELIKVDCLLLASSQRQAQDLNAILQCAGGISFTMQHIKEML